MRYLFTVSLLLLMCYSFAQEKHWDNYQPIEAKGAVPEDFTRPLLTLMEENEKLAEKIKDRTDSERAAQFYLESTYEIKNLLNSGRVIYGDTVTKYCRSVLDKVLANYPKLRQEIRLYLHKSPVHNAFTTNDGLIFVNTGLLSQLETEAQLAFVLAHEVVHYAEEHVVNEYLEFERIKDGDDGYENTSVDEKVSSISKFSKDSELEADKLGFKRYYKQTGYSLAAPNQLMDIMLYSYLPFNEIAVDKDFLNIASLVIPENKFLEEVAIISAVEDYDDSESTHPNIKKRRSEMQQNTLGETGGEDFLISKEAFLYCRKLSRFENTRLYVNLRGYEQAVYNAYLLLKENPNSQFLKKTIAKSLYAYSVYLNEDEVEDVATDFEDIEGESQQVHYLFSEMSASEMNVVAMAWILALQKDYPDDLYLRQAYNHCLDGLVYENDFVFEDFSDKRYEDILEVLRKQEENDTIAEESNSKVANIKRKKREENGLIGDNFVKYALADFVNDTILRNGFERRNEFKDEREQIQLFNARSESRDNSDLYDDNVALGIDKAVVLNPRYLKIDIQTFETKLERKETIKRLYEYKDLIRDMAQSGNLSVDMLTQEDINPRTAEEFNHHAALSLWLSERMRHVNRGTVVSEVDFIGDAKEYYNTNYIIYTGNFNARESNSWLRTGTGALLSGFLFYPAAPRILSSAFAPNNNSFNFYYVFDLRNGNCDLAENTYYEDPDAKDFLKSMMYNNILQTSSTNRD